MIDFSQRKDCNCHAVASLFKQWLAMLSIPLLTHHLYEDFINGKKVFDDLYSRLVSIEDENVTETLSELIDQLPPLHSLLLYRLLEFLQEVASYEEVNKMSASNLATVFTPSILSSPNVSDPIKQVSDLPRATDVVQYMIENYEKIFKQVPLSEFEEDSLSSPPKSSAIEIYPLARRKSVTDWFRRIGSSFEKDSLRRIGN